MTYLVMECHPAYAIVLDQDGRVIKTANMGYDAGQKVDSIIPLKEQAGEPLRIRFAAVAAAACLCAALLGGGAWGAFLLPYGTVELSINPHVSMDVSYLDRVVGLKGLNDDGIRLTEAVDYSGKSAVEMSEILAQRAVDMGYLSDGGAVHVAAASKSRRWNEKRESAISEDLTKLFEGRMEVSVVAGKEADAPLESAGARPAAVAPETLPSPYPLPQETGRPEIPTPAMAPETPATKPPVQPEPAPPIPAMESGNDHDSGMNRIPGQNEDEDQLDDGHEEEDDQDDDYDGRDDSDDSDGDKDSESSDDSDEDGNEGHRDKDNEGSEDDGNDSSDGNEDDGGYGRDEGGGDGDGRDGGGHSSQDEDNNGGDDDSDDGGNDDSSDEEDGDDD